MIKKRPKDCPQKNKICILESTWACEILTKLRRGAGDECCKGSWERKFPNHKLEEENVLRGEEMKPPKPKNEAELKKLVESGDIEIMLAEDICGQLTRLLLCDHRRSYEEGEIYEIVV